MEIDYGDNNRGEVATDKLEEEERVEDSNNEIMQSDIPVQEWQREVERMSSKLKTDYKATNIIGEWRGHIEQIKGFDTVKYDFKGICLKQNFEKSIPNTRLILEKLAEDINKSLEKISKKESMISKNFTSKVRYDIKTYQTSDYKSKQKDYNEQYIQYNELTTKIVKMEKEYDILEDKIDELTVSKNSSNS